MFLPTVTLPKERLVGFNVSFPTAAVVPEPERPIVAGDAGSLLVIETLPESLPVEVGANVVVNVADCPALIVNGVVTPETPNEAPLTVITLILRSEPPELVSVTSEESFVPVVTKPKLTLRGLALSCGPAGVAVAERVTGAEKVPESVFNNSVPFTAPAVLPLKETARFAVAPATKEKGNATPETANWLLLRLADVIPKVVVPVFLTDSD